MKRNIFLEEKMNNYNNSDLIIIFNQSNIEDVSKRIEYDCEHNFKITNSFSERDNVVAICEDVDYDIFSEMCKKLTCNTLEYFDLDIMNYEKNKNIFDSKYLK